MKKFVFIKTTPLHQAAAFDKRNAILKLLLSHKDVDIDFRRPSNNETPLHEACHLRQTRNVKTLLSFNASTKSKNFWGDTPKQVATEDGATKELIQLLEEGEKV